MSETALADSRLRSTDSLSVAVHLSDAAMAWRVCRSLRNDGVLNSDGTFVTSKEHKVAMLRLPDGSSVLDREGRTFTFPSIRVVETTGGKTARQQYQDLLKNARRRARRARKEGNDE